MSNGVKDEAEQVVSVSRTIAAPAGAIFDILADPARHSEIDGSGTVKGVQGYSPQRLEMGSKFGMQMRLGVPYRISNTIVEFEEDRLITWQHFGKHRWRYELERVDGGTRVVESFDWSTSFMPWAIELMGYPKKHPANMEKTLERLEQVVLADLANRED